MRTIFQPFLFCSFAAASCAVAEPLLLTLQGNVSTDIWTPESLSASSNPGFPGALNFSLPWPSPIPAASGDAFLAKTANGPGGAPIPSGQSIYFVSFTNVANAFGGTLAIHDDTPAADLSTLALQIEIGGANGYDLWNNDLSQPPDLSEVKLHYTTTGGADGVLQADAVSLLDRFYTFAVDMPVGPNGEDLPVDVYNRLYGLQWDLSAIGPIASFRVEFSGVEHAQLYHLRLDQSDHPYGAGSVFPQDAVWTAAGSDNGWSTAENWQDLTPPGPDRNLRFAAAGETLLPAGFAAKSLTFSAPDPFVLGGPALALTSGINAFSPAEITAPLLLENYNLFEIAAGNTLTLAAPLTGAGFYKQGPGGLILSADNLYDSQHPSFQSNGLIFSEGETLITGTNTLTGGSGTLNIRPDTTVRLAGGDHRLDPSFTPHLLGATSRLVLGDAAGKSDQTFAGLAGAISGVPVTGSKVTGGSSEFSTLILATSGTSLFSGDLGGEETHANHLHLIKTGPGFQLLAGDNTHTGGTVIREGTLGLDPTGRAIELAGGVLALHDTDHSANLGSGPAEILFTGDSGFAAHGTSGSVDSHTITLNGGASLSWDDFLPHGRKLMLSAAGTNRTLQFATPLHLGDSPRLIEVNDGSANVDARLTAPLSGTAGFHKTGTGIVELTAANPLTGTTLLHAGTLTITGTDGAFAGDLTGGPGTFLRVINTTGSSRDHRLSPSSSIILRGGYFTYNALASSGNTEAAGSLLIEQGSNTLLTNRANAGSSTHLTFADLTRHPGATLNFSGSNIGNADARNQVHFATPPSLSHGIIGGWAHAANEFATYGNHGIVPLETYTTTAQDTWTSADNVKVTTAAPATLTEDRSIHSLRLVGGTGGHLLDLGGNTLRVESGGILANGGNDSNVTHIDNGRLTSGSELILLANGPTHVSAAIADPVPGSPLGLLKSGSYLLTLHTPTAHTGPTLLNQGGFKLTAAANLESSSLLRIHQGATLDTTALPAGLVSPVSQTLAGAGTLAGSAEVHGTFAPSPSASSPFIVNGDLTLKANSRIRVAFEELPGSVLHSSARINGTLDIEDHTEWQIEAPSVDFGRPYWTSPRTFPLLTASSPPDPDSPPSLTIHAANPGAWSLSFTATGVVLHWNPPGGLQAWRKTHFHTSENTGDAADHADPDGDGLVNLLEYALGSDPLSHSPADAPALTSDRAALTFAIPGPPPGDLTYEVQISFDLEDWRTLASLAPGNDWTWHGEDDPRITLTPAGDKTLVSIGDDTAGPSRRFFRLKTTLSDP